MSTCPSVGQSLSANLASMGVAQREKRVRRFRKHMGPSSHPSGSPQEVHGRGTGQGTDPPTKPGTGDTAPADKGRSPGKDEETITPPPTDASRARGEQFLVDQETRRQTRLDNPMSQADLDAARPPEMFRDRKPAEGFPEIDDPPTPEEAASSGRPTTFEEFIGQRGKSGDSGPVNEIESALRASKNSGDIMPHVLLSGPPGLGKTTLAGIIAAQSGANVITVGGGTVNTPALMTRLLSQVEEGDILFIDEIHALDRNVQEILFPAMEDFKMDLKLGTQTLRIDLPEFTLIGATTRKGGLDDATIARFGIDAELEPLFDHEISQVIELDATRKGVTLEPGVASYMASRAQGVPRRAGKFMTAARRHSFDADFGEFSPGQPGTISIDDADAIFRLKGIDSAGLGRKQRKYLGALKSADSAIGVRSISNMIGSPQETIELVLEPYLLKNGFYTQTPRGRLLTTRGRDHLESLEEDDVFGKASGVRPKVLKHLGPGDHPSGSPQSVHGSGARGASRGDIESDIEDSGGFTVDPATGARPTEGYMVALEQFEQIYPPGTLTVAKIGKYRATNWAQFSDIEGAHWGGWKEADGTITFDVSIHTDSLETAMETGRQWNQKAIYNLDDGTEIFLDEAA